jgi:hypothetical protein
MRRVALGRNLRGYPLIIFFSSYNAERRRLVMKGKGLIFALIAAAIGGIASEAVERGLNAADEKIQKIQERRNSETGDDEDETDEDEDEDD